MPTKNPNDLIGSRARDLPACIAVPQPAAPPRTPLATVVSLYLQRYMYMYTNLVKTCTKLEAKYGG
jgi:hypothetical protein